MLSLVIMIIFRIRFIQRDIVRIFMANCLKEIFLFTNTLILTEFGNTLKRLRIYLNLNRNIILYLFLLFCKLT